jgi:hypothetical protein
MPKSLPARFLITALALASLLIQPITAQAQFGIAARASTLGFGGELSWRGNKTFGVRAGGNYFQISKDVTWSGNPYHMTAQLENFTGLVDFYPTGGSFHLSGGLLYNKNNGVGNGTVTSGFTLNGVPYTSAQISSLTGTVDFRHTSGYLGLGFSGRSRISVLFDLGVGFTGTPTFTLVGVSPLTGAQQTAFQTNLAAEQAKVQSEDLDGKSYLKYYPVISLGLKVGL